MSYTYIFNYFVLFLKILYLYSSNSIVSNHQFLKNKKFCIGKWYKKLIIENLMNRK